MAEMFYFLTVTTVILAVFVVGGGVVELWLRYRDNKD